MEHLKAIKDLQVKLSRWKSHREVHAQPSDEMLYDVINGLFELFLGESEINKPVIEIPDEPEQIQSQETLSDNGEEGGPGGNNPEAPDVP